MSKRVAELEGAELDYWVAMAQGMRVVDGRLGDEVQAGYVLFSPVNGVDEYGPMMESDVEVWAPSIDWDQGGPIIEDECIDLLSPHGGEPEWTAIKDLDSGGHAGGYTVTAHGSTPLIAAMRAFVASKYGDTVEAA